MYLSERRRNDRLERELAVARTSQSNVFSNPLLSMPPGDGEPADLVPSAL